MTPWPDERICFFGRTTFRNEGKVFGITQADRRSHMHILGQTGTGKSTLLETLLRQDLGTGQGVLLLDPHGDLVRRVNEAVPERRRAEVLYWNVADTVNPLGFNPLAPLLESRRHLMASFMVDAFKKLWPDFWGPRLEHVLRNSVLLLLDQPSATLADIPRLFADASYRKQAVMNCGNAAVRSFWLHEYEGYSTRLRAEAIAPIQNKVGAFLSHPVLNPILTQRRSSFSLREIMDTGKVLLVNLSRGLIGEDATALLGSLILSAVGVVTLSRAELDEERRRDFFVFLDEFQSFTTQALADMLAEFRKYKVGLVLAHQHLGQLNEAVKEAVLGNVGTTICFRVGPEDAKALAPRFAPEFKEEDLMGLPNHHIYLRLMVNGVVSRPFSASSIGSIH